MGAQESNPKGRRFKSDPRNQRNRPPGSAPGARAFPPPSRHSWLDRSAAPPLPPALSCRHCHAIRPVSSPEFMVIPRRAFTLTLLTGLVSPHILHAQSAKRVARVGFLAPGGPGIDSWGASVETF